jgi:membrane-associated PAP2 superfamily phosphatase
MKAKPVDWRLWVDIWLPAALLAIAAIIALPGIDLAASGLVGDPVAGFPLAGDTVFAIARALLLAATAAVLVAAAAAALLGVVSATWRPVVLRDSMFVLSAFLLGPGLLVDGLLKRFSGRVRPMNVEAFGGPLRFEPAFDFSGPCGTDCSFVSAETAAVTVAMMCLVLVVGPRLGVRQRALLCAVAVLSTLAAGALRIAMGAHFLSDVIGSIVLMTALVPALHIVFGLGHLSGPAQSENPRGSAPVGWDGRP